MKPWPVSLGPRPRSATLGEAMAAYLEGLRRLGAAAETVRGYRKAFARFRLQPGMPLRSIEIAQMTFGSRATARATIYKVKLLFARATEAGWLLEDPAHHLRIPRQGAAPVGRVLPARTLRRWLDTMPGESWQDLRDRAILETSYSGALRRGEILRMEPGDLDLAAGLLRVRGKGDRERMVPLGRRAVGAIGAYLRVRGTPTTGRLWLGERGGPLSPNALSGIFAMRAKAARIAGAVTPHVLRRSCATHMIQSGAGPALVQELLGHASVVTLMRYVNLPLADVRKAVVRFHPRGR